jgi:branched-chain amino acid transport system substrate-binding protein
MERMRRFAAVAGAALLLGGLTAFPGGTLAGAPQTPGVTKNTILIGTSLPLSGVAAAYGAIAYGSKAYFDYVNAHGGVYGRKIKLDILDDGYDPARTKANVQNLVSNKGVFALLDVLGTANNLAVRPFIDSQQVPLVYPATGSSLMAHPVDKYTFAIQTTYTVEGKVLTDYAVNHLHAKRIGVFYQNDDFGKEGLDAIQARAQADGASVVDAEPYELTQTDFSAQALKLKGANADAVIIFAVPGPFITFVATLPKVGFTPAVLSSDVSLAYVVTKVLGPLANGLYFDAYSVLPQASTPKAALFRQVVTQYGTPTTAPVDTLAEVGFGAAQVMVEALKRAGPNPTRKGLLNALQSFRKWSGSIFGPLTYTAKSHAGLKGAYIVQVQNGVFKPLTKYQYPKYEPPGAAARGSPSRRRPERRDD